MSTTPPQPVNPHAQTNDLDETAPRGIESTGSLRGEPDQPTTAGGPGSASGTEVLQHIGDYVVVKKIGEGGMGAVYLAEDTKLHRKAAIKTMKPELAANPTDRDRFLREARAAAAVEHDNIVPIWQIGEAADGTPFIAMPFLQGEMLDSRLKRDRVCNLGILVKVAREVADGLAAAHAKGLIHRDIKPGNIWLEGDLNSRELAQQIRRCKILDFGLARSVDKEDVQITASGAILGTPAYMAPEQARGEKVDHRADLFSLGVMLYRMATGQLPFRGRNAMAVLIALTTETPPSVRTLNSNLPPALADLIDRLMSKDPAGRPQTAAEVSATVRQIVKDVQAKKSSVSTPAAPPSPTASSSQPVPVYVLPAPAPNAWEEVTEAEEDEPIAKVPEVAKPSRVPWYIAAGVLGLFALVAVLAVVIIRVQTAEGTLVVEINDPDVEARIKNGKLVLVGSDGKERYTITAADRSKTIDAGAYTIRVEGADGLVLDTREFTLKKNGQVTVRVTLDPKLAKKADPKKDAPNLEADRTAAEYVLSIGGTVRVNDGGNVIAAAAGLPKEPFRLTTVFLRDNKQVSDAGLAAFRGCKNLSDLNLASTPLTDAGMAHLRDCNLSVLWVDQTQVGDAGMTYLKNCKSLTQINLFGTRVTDEGLANLEDCTELTHLNLGFIKATDEGLERFNRCKKLVQLGLYGTQLSDAGLAHFKGCAGLTHLYLNDTRATDAGLAHFKDCKGLQILTVQKSKVTPKGVADFAKALPLCKIEHDGGTIQPTVILDPDRTAAEYVLSIGGTVRLNDGGQEIKDAKDLPKGPFRLTQFNLAGNKQVTDAGLASFKDCKSLTHLRLDGTKVTDASLAHFKDCKSLTYLGLDGTGVSDACLIYFKDCKDLTHLGLIGTRVDGMGLKFFKDCKNLTVLNLDGTQVDDVGLAHFAGCKNLTQLGLAGTHVSDAGLANFKDCKDLSILHMPNAMQVRDAGMAQFKECKKLTSIALTNTKVGDTGLAHFKGCKHLTQLALDGTQLTDQGLANFKDCKNLRSLELNGTQVSDAGLTIFVSCGRLEDVLLKATKVTATGVAQFAKAQPQCKIEHDGGIINPAKK